MIDIKIGDKIIPDIKLLIFDKDGTLMELHHYWCQMVGLRAQLICDRLHLGSEHIAKIAYEMGADLKANRLRPEGPVGIKKREIIMQAAIDYLSSMGHNDAYNLCFDVFKDVDEMSSKNLEQFVRPIKGADNLLNEASRHGCKIAIATTDRRERARLALEHLGFADTIDLIVGADDVTHQKPDPEQIYLILDRLLINREQGVMIGDALTDVQMGINAGLKASIGVLTGFATCGQLKEITPYMADDVSKIEIVNNGRG